MTSQEAIVLLVTLALVLLSIGVHYESFRLCAHNLGRVRVAGRLRVAIAVLVATAAHLTESLLFAVGLEVLVVLGCGSIAGATHEFRDTVYFSMVTYTSLGIGDLVPLGPLRLVAGVEALTGLVMIAWTASFTFFEMQRFWRGPD